MPPRLPPAVGQDLDDATDGSGQPLASAAAISPEVAEEELALLGACLVAVRLVAGQAACDRLLSDTGAVIIPKHHSNPKP